MNQTITNKGRLTSNSCQWFTPLSIIERVKRVIGEIDLDPASCEEANKLVGAKQIYTKETNGLDKDWIANTVFLNYPGSKTKINGLSASTIWWEKFYSEFHKGNFSHGFFLGFSVEQLCLNPSMLEWFVCFMRNRIHFIPETPRESNPSHSNFMLLLSDNADVINRFGKEFGEIGKVICGIEVKNWI